MKSCNVDGSVGIPHVRVEHRRGFIKEKKPQVRIACGFLFWGKWLGEMGIVDKVVANEYF